MARSIAAVALVAAAAGLGFSLAAPAEVDLPRPDHTVVVVLENHSYSQVIGNPSAPFINSLRARGANLTDSHGVTHRSEPNYLALFAGTTENWRMSAPPPNDRMLIILPGGHWPQIVVPFFPTPPPPG